MNLLKTFLALVLALNVGLLTAQPIHGGRTSDLNHDGVVDTLAFADDPIPCDYNYLAVFTFLILDADVL